jgi:hypothetical protein
MSHRKYNAMTMYGEQEIMFSNNKFTYDIYMEMFWAHCIMEQAYLVLDFYVWIFNLQFLLFTNERAMFQCWIG